MVPPPRSQSCFALPDVVSTLIHSWPDVKGIQFLQATDHIVIGKGGTDNIYAGNTLLLRSYEDAIGGSCKLIHKQ